MLGVETVRSAVPPHNPFWLDSNGSARYGKKRLHIRRRRGWGCGSGPCHSMDSSKENKIHRSYHVMDVEYFYGRYDRQHINIFLNEEKTVVEQPICRIEWLRI